MSFELGWAALNLEMPPRVPRTEYSAEGHWALLSAVTGIEVGPDSEPAVQDRARRAFYQAWDYSLHWSTLIGGPELAAKRTHMGHAVYAAGGVDYDTRIDCPFATPEEVLAFDPFEAYGPVDQALQRRRFEQAYQANCAANPHGVNMTGVYITCVSGLIEIFGWEMLLLAAGTDSEAFGALTERYNRWVGQFFEALAAADVPAVMLHDDIVWTSGPFLHPEWYRRFVFPHYGRTIAPLRESGKKVLFTSDGDYTLFIDDIAAAGVHGFVLEPMTDMAGLAQRYGRTHAFVGNVDTRVLLLGTREQIRAEVERCMAIGKGCPGFFLAVGNHIPANTPVDNALYYNEVYEQLARR